MIPTVLRQAAVSTRVHRVPPIVGKVLGLGTAAAWSFWYGVHLPGVRQRDEFYLNLEKTKTAERAHAVSEFVSGSDE
ncbi:hypothetical protein BDY24DRAFT_412973 [Mrakia frigida]|uniref:uncharacterized protein n=1 Tax=Mrakia frigida TaxID=29902 RepID=UPI003FCC0A7C